MFKILLKKQLRELMESYIPKKRRLGSGRQTGYLLLYAALLILWGVSLGATMSEVAEGLLPIGLDWLYFLLVMLMALMLGIVGSVFAAYATLYNAKDNEFLLSLPIPPRAILYTRMLSVALSSALFELVVFVPAFVVYFMKAGFAPQTLLGCLMGLVSVSMTVLALTCFFGWIVALISAHTRNKSIVTVLVSLVLIAVYYVVFYRLNTAVQELINNAARIGESISQNAAILKLLAQGFIGNFGGMALLFAMGLVLLAATAYILGRGFSGILTANKGEKRAVYRQKQVKNAGAGRTLLRKEFRRFYQSPNYMLNMGMGMLMTVFAIVYLLIKFSSFSGALSPLLQELKADADVAFKDPGSYYAGGGSYLPFFHVLVCLAPALLPTLIMAISPVSAPSISLEGQSLWIIRSLPVTSKRILNIKQLFSLIILVPAPLILCVLLCALTGASALSYVTSILFVLCFALFVSALGLTLGLKHPNLDWTNESAVVKQGAAVGITMLLGMALPVVVALIAFLLRKSFNPAPYMWIIPAIGAIILNRWVYTKGTQKLEELG